MVVPERVSVVATRLGLCIAVSLCGTLSPRAASAVTRGAIVVLGDSITYGEGAGRGHDWPAVLGRRLPRGLLMVNRGLRGNTLLARPVPCPTCGRPGLARFGADVLRTRGVGVVVLALGLNDLLAGRSAAQIAAGLLALERRAHAAGLRVVGVTVTPDRTSPGINPQRAALNAWIRHSDTFDGVIDADDVLRDPALPTRLLGAYASPDGRHPNAAGYRALAQAVALRALTG